MAPAPPGVRDDITRGGLATALAICAVMFVGTHPWIGDAVEPPQAFLLVYGIGIFLAHGTAALLFFRSFLEQGQRATAIAGAGMLFSATMIIPHTLSFPSALPGGPLFGTATTAMQLVFPWRIGLGVALLAALIERRFVAAGIERIKESLRLAFLAVAVCLATTLLCNLSVIRPVTDGQFGILVYLACVPLVALWVSVGIRAVRESRHAGAIAHWIALNAIFFTTDALLSVASGGRFTIGWYLGKCASLVSSFLLLGFLIHTQTGGTARRRAPLYAIAFCLVTAAALLRWSLTPWLGHQFPFATLFSAVAATVWMAGLGPAIFAAVCGYGLVIVPTFQGFSFAWALALALYALSCGIIVVLGHTMRQDRNRLRHAERLFRTSQEGSLAGYALFSVRRGKDGRIEDFVYEYINPRGAERTGIRPQEMIGKSLKSVFPGIVEAGLFDTYVRVVETGKPAEMEFCYSADGVDGWFHNMVVRAEDGVAISFTDISARKRIERELEQRAADLQRVNLNKSQFLATLSHELRNPLAPIRNGITLLKMQPQGARDDTLRIIERQLTHLVRLVDDLLDVSRIDRGKLDLKRQLLALESAVRTAIDTARPNIEARHHQLLVQYAPDLKLDADPDRITQLVANLLNNAAKFTPSGGRIEITMRAEGDDVVLSVRDNGIGIDPASLESIFEMFVQLGDGDRGAGLGLGLALSRAIAEMHGGSLVAQSPGRGQGATFVLRLPRMASASPTQPIAEASRAQSPQRRVLVIDDNVDAANMLSELIRQGGNHVETCFDGATALRRLDSGLPDVAFVDLNMPGIDGLEFAKRLRARPDGDRVFLVAMTGMGQAGDRERTAAAGFDCHLTKPASTHAIFELVQSAGAVDGPRLH